MPLTVGEFIKLRKRVRKIDNAIYDAQYYLGTLSYIYDNPDFIVWAEDIMATLEHLVWVAQQAIEGSTVTPPGSLPPLRSYGSPSPSEPAPGSAEGP